MSAPQPSFCRFLLVSQARALLSAFCFFACLLLSYPVHLLLPSLARYDALFILLLPLSVLVHRYQIPPFQSHAHPHEGLWVQLTFHVLGYAFELFKVNYTHSWSYPEAGLSKCFGVPLYAGFMYGAVGAYISASFQWYRVRVKRLSRSLLGGWIGLCYLSFFLRPFIHFDLRYISLLGLSITLFYTPLVGFTTRPFRLRALYPLLFLGVFVYLAENIATFGGAWVYRHQASGWMPVKLNIITSWMCLAAVPFGMSLLIRAGYQKRRESGVNGVVS